MRLSEFRWLTAALRWVLLTVMSVAGWLLFGRLGLTAPSLFAALLVAVVFALTSTDPLAVPRPLSMAAQGALAVTIGLMLDPETLATLGDNAIIAAAVGMATLAVSAAFGAMLSLHKDVDAVTGILSMIAGGATGLVAITRELGGDQRIVAVAQYLRVALVVVTMPLVVTFVFHADTTARTFTAPIATTPAWTALLFLAVTVVIGTATATLIRMPAPATLGPLFLSGACELTGWPADITVPPIILPIAFLLVGWQAGLAFTISSLRAVGRILPFATALVLIIGGICAALGWALSTLTGTSLLTGYLATTPGGLAAVLAVAATTDSDVTFVACVQLIRLIAMLVSAPLIAKLTLHIGDRRRSRRGPMNAARRAKHRM